MDPTSSRGTCTVELSRETRRDLKQRQLRPHLTQILRALATLETDPYAGHALAGSLSGLRSLTFTVKGSGAFRAVYGFVDEDTVCLVIIVGPHENIYAKAERRVKALRSAGAL
jgi:mRNA-degrading endonuclease RelE of RelBE toxin-antitoxin system